ncbi:MAG: hypothetical protein H6822_01705 [Planctomycetaceae bacterium]|nr:hypothetical protein [Planctomycetales bacterium]MCB9920863.1 hypothetical protein [Planctomycetaceae bacterium]
MSNSVRHFVLLMIFLTPSMFLVGCRSQLTEEEAASQVEFDQAEEEPSAVEDVESVDRE